VPCIIISPWTAGGWVASETFDHTSTLRFLERITGVTIPNISDWRRKTFGDLTSALGLAGQGRFPRLPDTKPSLARAVENVASLPAVELLVAEQTPPVQERGSRPRHRRQSREGPS
jgi:phospholipase C